MKPHTPEKVELSEYALNYARNKQNYLQLVNGQINMTLTYMNELLIKPIEVMKKMVGDNPDEQTKKALNEYILRLTQSHDTAFSNIHAIYESLKGDTEATFNEFSAWYRAHNDPNSLFAEGKE